MLLRSIRAFLLGCAFTLAFLVNPMFVAGCISGDDDEPSAERLAQIEAALDARLDDLNGVSAFPFTHEGVSYELLLALHRRERDTTADTSQQPTAWARTAHACGTKTFYASASACATNYELAIEGTLTLRRTGDDPATILADEPVVGRLDDYSVDLSFGDNTTYLEGDAFRLSTFQAKDLGADKLDIAYTE